MLADAQFQLDMGVCARMPPADLKRMQEHFKKSCATPEAIKAVDDKMKKFFDEADADKDGKLDRKEWDKFVHTYFEDLRKTAPGEYKEFVSKEY